MNNKAKKILFDTYWSSAGWKQSYSTPVDDLLYAQKAGYMFSPTRVTHDEIVERAVVAANKVGLVDVVNAFLASLSSRRLELRSALGSYAVARHLQPHRFVISIHGYCILCGELPQNLWDRSVLSFERYKWGGARHTNIRYIAFDLEQFDREPVVSPTDNDLDSFRRVLAICNQMPPKSRVNDLERALQGIFSSNKDERRACIEILGYCGVLDPAQHKGFFYRFVPWTDRPIPPSGRNDWSFPASWWRGSDGVNDIALSFYFSFVLGRDL
jgi:hypothetical protein